MIILTQKLNENDKVTSYQKCKIICLNCSGFGSIFCLEYKVYSKPKCFCIVLCLLRRLKTNQYYQINQQNKNYTKSHSFFFYFLLFANFFIFLLFLIFLICVLAKPLKLGFLLPVFTNLAFKGSRHVLTGFL